MTTSLPHIIRLTSQYLKIHLTFTTEIPEVCHKEPSVVLQTKTLQSALWLTHHHIIYLHGNRDVIVHPHYLFPLTLNNPGVVEDFHYS